MHSEDCALCKVGMHQTQPEPCTRCNICTPCIRVQCKTANCRHKLIQKIFNGVNLFLFPFPSCVWVLDAHTKGNQMKKNEVREQVANYLSAYPDVTYATVSAMLCCSIATVGKIAREYGITRQRKALNLADVSVLNVHVEERD